MAPTASPARAGAPASVHVALITVQVLFASLSVAGKVALSEGLSPFAVIVFRAPTAFFILLTIFIIRRHERVTSPDLIFIAFCALFGITLNQLLFIGGLSRTTATNAVVIGASIPVFVVAVALVLRREAATPAKLAGLGLALVGALVVVGGDRLAQNGGHLVGNLLIVANSFCFAIYLVISRPLFSRYGLITVMTWTFLFGAIGVLPFGGAALCSAAPHLSPRVWMALGYIVAGPTIGTYLLNGYALGRAPSSLVAIYIYVQPVLGALMAAAYLHERPGPGTLAGACLIGLGIWLVNRASVKRAT